MYRGDMGVATPQIATGVPRTWTAVAACEALHLLIRSANVGNSHTLIHPSFAEVAA